MKEVTQPWAGNPAEAELGRLYIGSPCVRGRLQVEGFPTIAARSASGRVHVCSTALLAHFFHEPKASGDAAATHTQRGPDAAQRRLAAHGWRGAKLPDQNNNRCFFFPENVSYRN